MHDIDTMKRLFHAGRTWRQIADEMGIPHSTARYLGDVHGLRRRPSRAEMRRSRESRREQLLALFHAGAGWEEIGRALGIPPTTARSQAASLGLPPRHMKPQFARSAVEHDEPVSPESDAPSAADATASEDSLRLSPYVLRRIEELGIHGRRVQPEERWSLPVFSGG